MIALIALDHLPALLVYERIQQENKIKLVQITPLRITCNPHISLFRLDCIIFLSKEAYQTILEEVAISLIHQLRMISNNLR
jgi:hypothetical protein